MNMLNPPQIMMGYTDEERDIRSVQVTAFSQEITVAYFNAIGTVIEAFTLSIRETPELNQIVRFTPYGDLWDMELLEAIIEQFPADEPAPALAPLIPAYLESLGVSA